MCVGMGNTEDDLQLRQTAMQIALQLPGDQVAAVQVLKYAEELRRFLAGASPPEPPGKQPLRLV